MATSAIPSIGIGGSPLWYKDAIIYELHVRAFFDSNGDGIGDFRGPHREARLPAGPRRHRALAAAVLPVAAARRRLRHRRLHATSTRTTAPCATSTRFLEEAHARGLRVITELVINHTSDQHPWFQRARRAPPGSRWRDFYVWSDTPRPLPRGPRSSSRTPRRPTGPGTRSPQPYFWHRFYSHQPDLNFDNPEVREADARHRATSGSTLGVDGLRLDAIPYLFEREGTNCENLPETHAFLKELRAPRRRASSQDRMLLAEANQWPEDAVAYFGERRRVPHGLPLPADAADVHGDAHGGPLPDRRHPRSRRRRSRTTASGRIFLRNHDELTLEMVTDEERDYMYRVYAARPADAHQPRHPPPAGAAARTTTGAASS